MSYPELLQLDQSRTETGGASETPASRLVPQMLSGPLTRGKLVGRVRPPNRPGWRKPPDPAYHDNASKGRLWGKLEVLQVFDVLDSVGDLHHTLSEGHFEADVLCPDHDKGQAVREPRRPQAPA